MLGVREKMNDWRLLRQYLDDGSQAAFTRLVTRHMKIVYWTCRRDLEDAHLAEDAAQAVFVLLAEKARTFTPGLSIAGWLFAASRYVCRNVKRSEARRLHYEQEAAMHMAHHPAQEADWSQIEPWLNDSLSSLGAGDREAILLRYVDGLSLAEVALATGITEPAARKRVSRAVERLRRYLVKREVALPSAAFLAALFAEHSAKAAPLDCQATALHAMRSASAKVALSPIHPLLAKGIFLVSTTKIIAGAAAAVVVLLALTFVVVNHERSAATAVARPMDWHTTPSYSETASVDWQAPPAPDPASQQAQQQIKSELEDWTSAYVAGDAQKAAAIYSPDYVHDATGTNNGKPVHFHDTYSDMANETSREVALPHRSAQISVSSCRIAGNSAIVVISGHMIGWGPRESSGFNDRGTRFVFANTGDKWLIIGRR